jgi:ATP-binding cassette subfamily E protein 1
MDEKTGKPHISESLCIGCGICINKCPHDALIIEQLPSELETDMIHRYSLNGFRLFRLPTPTKESVVGILGPNGMGKSTAFNALAGRMIPNLGDWLDQQPEWDNVIDSLPKGELRDFFISVRDGGIKVALKPQNVDRLPKRIQGTVEELLRRVDERQLFDEMTSCIGNLAFTLKNCSTTLGRRIATNGNMCNDSPRCRGVFLRRTLFVP